jgi:hypothetical protein
MVPKSGESVVLMHILVALAIIIFVGAVYMKVPKTYFCAYDDFLEIHRAAFEDAADTSKIMTTPHFNSYRYRPLNRAANFLTYRLGAVNPELYRTRNLAFHLLNVLIVFLLCRKLFNSILICAMGSLIFGLHPAANQTIIGAVNTNSMSHTAFLGACLMLMYSVDSVNHWALWLIGSVLSGWLSLMAYDSNIVVFALLFLWIILKWPELKQRPNHFRFMCWFCILCGSFLFSYLLLRHFYVPRGFTQATSEMASAGIILKNTLMYMGSLLLPIDVVLANEWLKTPLPSEIQFNLSAAIFIFAAFSLVILIVGLFCLRRLARKMTELNHAYVVFLISGVALPLLPVLILQSHPSETYLYLPTAFYAILVSYGLYTISVKATTSNFTLLYVPASIVLIILFASAIWVRNNRVFDCGQTARRILSGLPHELFHSGRWIVTFANVPDEIRTTRYGFYGFRGVDTIGHGTMADRAITSALQLMYHNKLLIGRIVQAEQLIGKCQTSTDSREICVFVHSDGRIKRLPG